MTDTTIAYGIRQSWSGKRTTVVRVTERYEHVRIGDLCSTRRIRLHRGIQSLRNPEMAALVAQKKAASENVPYVGYKADTL